MQKRACLGLVFLLGCASSNPPPPETTYGESVVSSGPVAFWTLDDGENPILDTMSGLHATASTGVHLHQPPAILSGSAVGFSGKDKIDVTYDPVVNPKTEFSVELWFVSNGGSGTRSPVTSRDTNAGDHGYAVYLNPSNQIVFTVGNGQSFVTLNSNVTVTVGEPYYVVAMYAHGTMQLSIDGNSVPAMAAEYVAAEDVPLRIGMGGTEGSGQFGFDGTVDEVAVYDHVLSADEIAEHYYLGTE